MDLKILRAFSRAVTAGFPLLVVGVGWVAAGQSAVASPGASATRVDVRFVDSDTGFAVQPEAVTVRAHRPDAAERRVPNAEITPAGRLQLALSAGQHTLTVASARHRPMSGKLVVRPDQPYRIRIHLDPVEPPKEIQPETVAALHRDGWMLLQGFVADEETGGPLAGVQVRSLPSGAETRTSGEGFFRLYVPAAEEASPETDAVHLVFEKPGYRAHERRYLEVWSRGDWTYRIRLERGGGHDVVDERTLRRRATRGPAPSPSPGPAPVGLVEIFESPALPIPQWDGPQPASTAPSNATVRVPRNIRVLRADGATIDYVSMTYYARSVLPSEWIASWGNYTGGSNSLNAGAVAVRSYAIGKLNAVSTSSTYDICATTACQVYNPANINSLTDTAVNFTEHYVLVNANGAIATTEYSAENNSLGYSCGDGYTQPTEGCLYDPICLGEARYGHGRGMCQWGSARWATARRMANRTSRDGTPTGFPRQGWQWIVAHYYPTLTLVKGAYLVVGDDVKVIGTSQTVRMCGDGGIASGVNCPAVTTKAVGSAGVILDGPVRVTADGRGFTWYKVQWSDGQVGWVPENWLERLLTAPGAPTALVVTALATNQIQLTWVDNAADEFGFKIERAPAAAGPWTQIATAMANITSHTDTNDLASGTTYFYRVRAFNSGGNSAYTPTAFATTWVAPAPTLTLQPSSQVKGLGQTVTFLVSATGAAPLGYQWRKEGVPLTNGGRISGTTTPMLTIANLQPADAGGYQVVITNAHGAATSVVAALTVSGLIVFEDDFDTNSATRWVTHRSSSDTRVTFHYDYSTMGIPPAPHAVGGSTRGVKFEANLTNAAAAAINLSPLGQIFPGDFKLRFDLWINANGPFPAGGTGSTEYVTAGVGTTGNRVQWTGSGSTADGVWFAVNGEGQAGDTSTTSDFNVYAETTVQTVATGVYAAGTASNARGNGHPYYATAFPGGRSPPLWQQANYPQQTGALAAGTVGFAWRQVLLNKQGNVVEWFIDGLKIAALTNAPLAGSNIFIGYWDPFTSVSDNAALSFGLVDNVRVEVPALPPLVTAAPTNQFVAAGGTAAFHVTAEGTAPLAYQWRLNGTNLPGGTQSSLVKTNVQAADAGAYTVVVTNIVGAVSSAPALLVVNHPPQLAPLADRALHAGLRLVITNSASDPDLPANSLSFSLDPGAPPGATVDPVSGVFSWATSDANAGSTNLITVRVTDDGVPPLHDTRTFRVIVMARPTVQSAGLTATLGVLAWSAIPGAKYRVQFTDDLHAPAWTDLMPDVVADGPVASVVYPLASTQRFFRLILLDP